MKTSLAAGRHHVQAGSVVETAAGGRRRCSPGPIRLLAILAAVFATAWPARSESLGPAVGEAALLDLLVRSDRSAAAALPGFAFPTATPRSRGAVPRSEFVPLAEAAAARHGLDAAFFKRLIHQESGYDPRAVSRAGAMGIAQFMPGTAAAVGLDDPFDPVKALPKSAEHLASLRARLGNDGLAAAAYNAGEGRVRAWLSGRSALPAETVHYVAAITGRAAEDWAPPGAAPLASLPVRAAFRGSSLPLFARSGSAEWQLGQSLLGKQGSRLADLMSPRRAAAASNRSAAKPAAGERGLCASLGCIVSATY